MRTIHAWGLVILCSGFVARADGGGEHQHATVALDKVGTLEFPISCRADQQKQFEAAVAVLHSFWYEESERLFREISRDDPSCAMAQWGVAMSLYHPLWQPPDPASLDHGARAKDYTAVMSGSSISSPIIRGWHTTSSTVTTTPAWPSAPSTPPGITRRSRRSSRMCSTCPRTSSRGSGSGRTRCGRTSPRPRPRRSTRRICRGLADGTGV